MRETTHSVSMASTACVLSAVDAVAQATSSSSVDRTSARGTAPRPAGSKTLKQKLSAPSSLPLQHCAYAGQSRARHDAQQNGREASIVIVA